MYIWIGLQVIIVAFSVLISLFALAWFIAGIYAREKYLKFFMLQIYIFFLKGNVWVFSNHSKVQYNDASSVSNYCDRTTYLFSFWIIVGPYILSAISLLIVCCGGGALIFGLFSKKRSYY